MDKLAAGDQLYLYELESEEGIGHELDALLARLPSWRRRQALSYRTPLDRFLCAKAFLLLQEGLRDHFGIDDGLPFAYGDGGKPFLPLHPEIHFNLSHCKKAIACAISRAPVGIDIETVPALLDEDLGRYCCSPKEWEAIVRAPSPPLAFTILWTRKEAFLKYSGEGLSDRLKTLLETPEAATVQLTTHVSPDGSYVYSVCRGATRGSY